MSGNARGWMTVVGRFISSFVYMGTSKAFGVLIPQLVVQLDSTEGTIGLCGSLFQGLPHIAGPFTTALVNRYGVRNVIMLGGTLTFVGLVSAFLSTNAVHLGVSLALAGFANGLCIIACIMPLTWYFPDRFPLVNSISATGGALGMMMLPPITEMFIKLYGWRGTMALLAALSSHSVLSGAVVKEPKHIKDEKLAAAAAKNEETLPLVQKRGQIRKNSCKGVLDSMQKHLDLCIFQMYPLIIDFQLLFLIFGTSLAAWVLFLVPDAMAKGCPPQVAAFLSTVGGIGHVLGRLTQGPLITYCFFTDVQLFGALSILCATCFLSDSWLFQYGPLAISAFIVGFATGAQYTLSLSMTKRLVSRDDLVLPAMGWTHLFIGIGKMIGGPLVGYLMDATGQYTASFFTLGGLEIVSIMIVLQLELKTRLVL